MTTTNDLYQAAVADANENKRHWGTSKHVLKSNGNTIICCVDLVAGKSIVRKHSRTTYRILFHTDEFSVKTSRAAVAEALKYD